MNFLLKLKIDSLSKKMGSMKTKYTPFQTLFAKGNSHCTVQILSYIGNTIGKLPLRKFNWKELSMQCDYHAVPSIWWLAITLCKYLQKMITGRAFQCFRYTEVAWPKFFQFCKWVSRFPMSEYMLVELNEKKGNLTIRHNFGSILIYSWFLFIWKLKQYTDYNILMHFARSYK